MMRRITIRARLLASFGALLLLLGASNWISTRQMRELHDAATAVVRTHFERVLLVHSGVAAVNENTRRTLELFLIRATGAEPDDPQFLQLLEEQKAHSRKLTKIYEQIEDALKAPEEQEVFGAILTARREYLAARAAAERTLAEGDVPEARGQMHDIVFPKLRAYLGEWDRLFQLEDHLANVAATEAAVAYEATKQRLLGLMIVAGLLAVGVAAWTTRAISQPLRRITDGAHSLRSGSEFKKIERTGDDELGELARAFNEMADAVVDRERYLRAEMDLAERLQMSLLPQRLGVRGFDVAGKMVPASEVGGDYYDVLPTERGFWIGVGDVSGHGLNAGLVMMMLQTAVATLVRQNPEASPAAIVSLVNAVLFENIRHRLGRRDHVTFTLLRFDSDGRVVFAGAHEDILIVRATTGDAEWIQTPGTWLGFAPDITAATKDTELLLEPGDLIVFHTDGVVEAVNAEGTNFGSERFASEVVKLRNDDLQVATDRVIESVRAWAKSQEDDLTVLLARYERGSLRPSVTS